MRTALLAWPAALFLLPAVAHAAPPVACLTATPASPLTNETTTLDSSCSTDDGGITARGWDLDNDGQFDDGTATSVTRSWPTPGTYTVRLAVTDRQGSTDVESKTVTVRNRSPVANFSVSPASPTTGQSVTFTSTSTDPDGTIASRAWDTDGDATADFNDGTGTSASRSFATSGDYPIRLRVVDNNGAVSTVTKTVTVSNRLPSATFTVSPASPLSQEAVKFTSTATDPDGTITAWAWDTDGDATADFNDGTGSTATKTWATPGDRVVRLRVTDNKGGSSIGTATVRVGNRPPVASFTVSPDSIFEGDAVTLTSTATDRDGTVGQQAWDLNNDGAYDDATGASASLTASPPGTYTVGLRAVDDRGAVHTVSQTYMVAERPAALPEERADPGPGTFDLSAPIAPAPSPAEPPAPESLAPLHYLDPFPVIRLRGRTTGRGAKLTVFTVHAPHGSLAELRCSGRGCTVKKTRKRIRSRRERGSATVHFPQVERFLPAGTEVQVRVTRKGMIGKYTRIKIRRLALPLRSDRCLLPDSTKPAACPQLP